MEEWFKKKKKVKGLQMIWHLFWLHPKLTLIEKNVPLEETSD